jgi:alkylation response protein AidB-like acyl-CoA dehydrogenase
MNFALTSDQIQLRDEIIRFARQELNGDLIAKDRDHVFSRDAWQKCGAMGMQGLPVGAEHGGVGLDPLSCALALEAFGYGCRDGGLVFAVAAHLLSCVVPIWKFGTAAQKERYLPQLCDGRMIGAHGMTEPGSGSDAFGMRTVARRDGAGYRLTGTKMFVSNAPVADMFVIFAMTDPEKAFHGGVTAFLVDRATEGLTTGGAIHKMGLRTSPMGEVVLDDVYVCGDAVLGGVGGGASVFSHSMEWERICLFASHLGTLERLLEQAIDYARSRTQFGQSIGKFQAVSHRIADMKVNLEAARLLTYRAAWRMSFARNVAQDAAIAKLFVSESLLKSALDTMQIFGGYGYTVEYEVERALRDAVSSTIYSGTSDMQRNIIARWLGL